MHDLIRNAREHYFALEPRKRERWGNPQRVQEAHTLVSGTLTVNCIECGADTLVMCQECSMSNDLITGVCKDRTDLCQRRHLLGP